MEEIAPSKDATSAAKVLHAWRDLLEANDPKMLRASDEDQTKDSNADDSEDVYVADICWSLPKHFFLLAACTILARSIFLKVVYPSWN